MTGEVLREWSEEKKSNCLLLVCPIFRGAAVLCASPIKRIILFFVEKEKREAEWNAHCVEVSYLTSRRVSLLFVVVSAAVACFYFVYFHLLQDFLELFPLDSAQLFSFLSLARI